MDKVKKLVHAGAEIPFAIKQALGMSVSDFADKHQLNRSSTASHINGNVRATDDTIAALIAELGGTEYEWRLLLWEAARPEAPPSVRATA